MKTPPQHNITARITLPNTIMNDVETLIAQTYKDHSARLLSVLIRVLGARNFELAEDVLQEAFSKALIHWQKNKIPTNPSAWIVQAAKNQAIDTIRAHKTKIKFANDLSLQLESEWSLENTVLQEFQEPRIKDGQLRMIFMCCHEDIKPENRIPFILKVLCGFSITAISRALILPETTVKKRLFRTKEKFKEQKFEFPTDRELLHTMDTVHTVLYLLFNEGFHSSDKKQAIKVEFCQEAIALVNLLMNEPKIANRDTFSLFSLMHFHIARLASRIDKNGFNVPIDLQDRTLWEKKYINTANQILAMADAIPAGASGRFFYEALIAKEHCKATCFLETDWKLIVKHYEKLVHITNSPIAQLNMAIAIGYSGEVSHAIDLVTCLQKNKLLQQSHMPLAVLAHLSAKAGNEALAYEMAHKSKEVGGTLHEHQLMMCQIERLLNMAEKPNMV